MTRPSTAERDQREPDVTGARAAGATGRADWDLTVSSLIAIWATGTGVFLAVVLVTDPHAAVARSVNTMALIGVTVLAILIVGRAHLPAWTPDLCAYLMYTIVGWVILVDGDRSSPFSFMYLWLAVHSFYFLTWRRGAPQLGYIALTYAAALGFLEGAFPLLRWAVTVATLVVVCTTIALLRAHVEELVARLQAQATTDTLTGILNRRGYEELIEIEIARADRTGLPLALAMADLDHFKAINDRYGHQVGDAVLARVAGVLSAHARRIDVAARLGGEEFVLVLPATDAGGAYLAAQRLRRILREQWPPGEEPVTMSFGVAAYPADAVDAASLLSAADTALRRAKEAGRNRVIAYSNLFPARP